MFQEFDLPEGLVGMYSLHEARDYSSIGGLGGKTTSTESIPWRLANDATENFIRSLEEFVNCVLGYITSQSRIKKIAKKVVDLVEEGKKPKDIDPHEGEIRMTMERRNETGEIVALVQAQFLQWQAGVKVLAENTGLDPSCFYNQPQLTGEQMAGVKPKDEGESSSKKQKTK